MATPQKTAVVCSMIVLVVLTVELGLSTAAIHPLTDCSTGKHGCCPDNVTFDERYFHCSARLCYDVVPDCAARKIKYGCPRFIPYKPYSLVTLHPMYTLCPKTCNHCDENMFENQTIQCRKSKYGCCYDEVTPAKSKDKRPGVGCPHCRNIPILDDSCRSLFATPKDCKTKSPALRDMLREDCFGQCGVCTNFKEVEKRIEPKDWRKRFY